MSTDPATLKLVEELKAERERELREAVRSIEEKYDVLLKKCQSVNLAIIDGSAVEESSKDNHINSIEGEIMSEGSSSAVRGLEMSSERTNSDVNVENTSVENSTDKNYESTAIVDSSNDGNGIECNSFENPKDDIDEGISIDDNNNGGDCISLENSNGNTDESLAIDDSNSIGNSEDNIYEGTEMNDSNNSGENTFIGKSNCKNDESSTIEDSNNDVENASVGDSNGEDDEITVIDDSTIETSNSLHVTEKDFCRSDETAAIDDDGEALEGNQAGVIGKIQSQSHRLVESAVQETVDNFSKLCRLKLEILAKQERRRQGELKNSASRRIASQRAREPSKLEEDRCRLLPSMQRGVIRSQDKRREKVDDRATQQPREGSFALLMGLKLEMLAELEGQWKQEDQGKIGRQIAKQRVREHISAIEQARKLEEERKLLALKEWEARLREKRERRQKIEREIAMKEEKERIDRERGRLSTAAATEADKRVKLIPLMDEKLRTRAMKVLEFVPSKAASVPSPTEEDRAGVSCYLALSTKPSPNSMCSANKLVHTVAASGAESPSTTNFTAKEFGKDDVVWVLRQDEDGIVRESKLMPLLATLKKDQEIKKKKREEDIRIKEVGWSGPAGGLFASQTAQVHAQNRLCIKTMRLMGVEDPMKILQPPSASDQNYHTKAASSSSSSPPPSSLLISQSTSALAEGGDLVCFSQTEPNRTLSPGSRGLTASRSRSPLRRGDPVQFRLINDYVPDHSIDIVRGLFTEVKKKEKNHKKFGAVENRLINSPFAKAFRRPITNPHTLS